MESEHRIQLIVPLVLCLAGGLWASGFVFINRWPVERAFGFLVILGWLGIVLRCLAFAFPAYQEIDFYRYFWDGIQFLNGFNPYAYPISDLIVSLPPDLSALQQDNLAVVNSIHDQTHLLSTIYAPGAIALFTVLEAIPGPREFAYFSSFVIAEGAALWLIFRYGNVREQRLGLFAIALNPLLIVTTYNGLHFDIWLLPLLIGWLFMMRRGHSWQALALLLAAIALRHWPIILLPLSLMAFPNWKYRIGIGSICSLFLLVLFLPQITQYSTDHSGLRIYGKIWEMNDALFILFSAILGDPLARAFVLLVPTALAGILSLTPMRSDPALIGLLSIGTLLMMSPTFFPWYWIWILPFLILSTSPLRFAGVALAAVLPMYYLRFFLEDIGQESVFDRALVWLEFGPILALLILLMVFHAYRPDYSRPK